MKARGRTCEFSVLRAVWKTKRVSKLTSRLEALHPVSVFRNSVGPTGRVPLNEDLYFKKTLIGFSSQLENPVPWPLNRKTQNPNPRWKAVTVNLGCNSKTHTRRTLTEPHKSDRFERRGRHSSTTELWIWSRSSLPPRRRLRGSEVYRASGSRVLGNFLRLGVSLGFRASGVYMASGFRVRGDVLWPI